MKKVIFFIIILILCSIVNSAGQVKDEWIITDSLNNYLAYFHDIKALDAENIFIAGGIFLSRSSVYVSNDSGKTFSIAFYDSLHISDNSNYTLSIPSEDFIFAAGSYGRYHISTDKGLTWKTDTLEIFGIDMQSYFDIFSSHFWDNKKGIICVWNNYNNYILKTTDAGKNWKEVMQLDSIIGINKSIQGFDSGTTYLISKEVNDNYYLYKSTDFGETWHETLNLPFPLDFKRCIFLNEQVGFMFGANSNPPGRDNFIYKTTDGGKSWNNVYDGYSERGGTIADMSFCDSLNGITAGMSFVLRTEDGGETWYQDTTFHLDKFPSTMRYVYMLNKNISIGLGVTIYVFRHITDENVSVNDEIRLEEINIGPNPAGEILYFSENENIDIGYEYEYTILTIDGKEIQKGIASETIHIQDLPSGSYYLILSRSNKLMYSKFIKE